MLLSVPFVQQASRSVDCGLAMAAMILQYFGISKTLSQIKKEISIYKCGTYAPQLGLFLLKYGFEVEIITQHPKLFTVQNRSLSIAGLQKCLQNISTYNTQNFLVLKFFDEYLKEGGNLKIKVPDLQDILIELKQKRPVGALLTTGFMDNQKPYFNFHFNLITGFNGKYLFMHDPARGPHMRRLPQDFFYGLFASAYGDLDNACLILCKKK